MMMMMMMMVMMMMMGGGNFSQGFCLCICHVVAVYFWWRDAVWLIVLFCFVFINIYG